jgi:predicted alpha/beta hydrolase family esterase
MAKHNRTSRGGDPTVLIVPGWNGSGPSHWQTIWEREHPEYLRVKQRDWHNAYRPNWVAGLEQAVLSAPGDVVLVAHSLGCLTVAWWAATRGCGWARVQCAMLVAPPDLSSAHSRLPTLVSFTPVPRGLLPFPSVLVASESDPYITFDAAADLAGAWGCGLVNAGKVGHINTDSGHGRWPEGEVYLQRLLSGIPNPARSSSPGAESKSEPWREEVAAGFSPAALPR